MAAKFISHLIILLIIFITVDNLSAAQYTWNSPNTGYWWQTAMWTGVGGSTYPGVGDTATINQGTVQANFTSTDDYATYYLDSNINLSGTGVLTQNGRNNLSIGMNSPSRLTITQTGGTMRYTNTAPMQTFQVNADWKISGGDFTTTAAYFGFGTGKTGSMAISENANVNITQFYLYMGDNGGTGHLTMTGGTLTITGGQSSGILLGGGYSGIGTAVGTGHFTMSGGTILGTEATSGGGTITMGSFSGSIGTMTMTGGEIKKLNNFWVGADGTGTFTMTGGSIQSDSEFFVGLGYANGGSGTMTMTGGNVSTSSFRVGDYRGSGLATNYTGTLNLSGGEISVTAVGIGTYGAVGTINHTGGTFSFSSPTSSSMALGYLGGTGIYNISGNARMIGGAGIYAYGPGVGYMNITGSNAEISVRRFNYFSGGSIFTKFTIDDYGVTTIFASNDVGLKDQFTVDMPGNFISLKVDHLDLASAAATLLNPELFAVDNKTPFAFIKKTLQENGRQIARLELVDTPNWDLEGIFRFSDDGLERGYLKVAGEYNYLQTLFSNLSDELTPLLVDYLNKDMANPDVRFTLAGSDILLVGNYLNEQAYAWFGWDLNGFNDAYDSDVKLLGFNVVPEPGTWALLLAGMAGMACLRFFRRKTRAC